MTDSVTTDPVIGEARAAVALLVRKAGTPEAEVLLGRRVQSARDPWSGHIAFPGGKREPADLDLLDTAVRELAEETGIALSREKATGKLPMAYAGRHAGPLVPVQPWLFFVDDAVPSQGDGELDELAWVRLASLDDPSLRVSSPVPEHMGVSTSLGVLWGMTLATLEALWFEPMVPGIRRLMLDFDGTFYDRHHPLFAEIDERISLYVAQRDRLSHEEGHQKRKHLYLTHGNTLHGLMHEGLQDPEHFLDFVFDMPDEVFPGPAPEIRAVFDRLSLPVDIFTNAQAAYVERTLRLMQLEGTVGTIHDLRSFGYDCKPHEAVYDMVASRHPEPTSEVLFVDDRPDNCATGLAKGYRSLLIRESMPDWSEALFRIDVLTDLPRFLLPRLGVK